MRKLMMTMMVLLLAVTVATAQRGQGQRGGEKLLNELDLTAEQQTQIEAVKQEVRAQMQELRKQNPEQRPARESMKKMREPNAAKVQAILTPEQRAKLETIKAERKAAWKSVDREALKADLKAHQDTKVKPVIAAARAKFDQLITAEDQATLDRLRPIFAGQRGRQGVRGKQGMKPGEKPGEEERAARKAKAEQWKTDHATEIAELKELTTKYKPQLKSLQERMAPQRAQWEKEKREIAARYLPEGAKAPKGRKGKANHKKGAGKPGKAGGRKAEANGKEKDMKGNWPRAAAFLLMKG